jgi:hypothetical protein
LYNLFYVIVILSCIDVITMGRLFPTDFLHGLNQGLVAYLLGWTLQMIFIVPLLDENFKDVPSAVINLVKEFPAYNSFHPVKHKRFEDITSLMREEKKVHKASDFFFGNTDIVALTETWKLTTALFQLLFVIITGKVFPSDLSWGKKVGISDASFNMERCFINAIVAVLEVYWYANAQTLCEPQVDAYRNIVSNAQSHVVILHHVRVLIMNKLSHTSWLNAKKNAERRKSKADTSESTETANEKKASKGVKVVNAKKKKKTVDLKFASHSVPEFAKVGKRFMGTYKFHLLQHFPDQVKDFGSVKENVDTSIMESTNKDMSGSLFQRSTKRYESVGEEMLISSEKRFHIDTCVLLAQPFLNVVEESSSTQSSLEQGHSLFFVSKDNKKSPVVSREEKNGKWDFGDRSKFPWHPQFNSVRCVYNMTWNM